MAMKRKRVYAPKRTSKKRRRYGRRRKSGVRVHAVANNQSARGTISNYRSRRTSKRAWRNLLWRNTATMSHFRAHHTSEGEMITPPDLVSYRLTVLKCFADFTSVANWNNPNGADPTAYNGRVVMRGGLDRLIITTEADEHVDCIVHLVYIKPSADTSFFVSAATLDKASQLNPIVAANDLVDQGARIMKTFKFTVGREAGNYTCEFRPKIKSYDPMQYAANTDCFVWYIYVGNTVTFTADTNKVKYQHLWNCSVCANVTSP